MFFKKKNLLQIAIDGTAGSGKSTVSKEIAKHYKIGYLSTGAIFRCFALAIQKESKFDYLDPKLNKKIIKKTHLKFIDGQFYLNGKDVSKEICQESIGQIASVISQQLFVRKRYEKITKKIIRNKSFVIEGRDIGTVILPKAKYKFYLDASIQVRVKRRVLQLKKWNLPFKVSQQSIARNLKTRDDSDKHRKLAALVVAKDAVVINTDNKKINETVSLIIDKISN